MFTCVLQGYAACTILLVPHTFWRVLTALVDIHTHIHTHTHNMYILSLTLTLTLPLSLSHTHTHTHCTYPPLSHIHTLCTFSLSLSLSLSFSLSSPLSLPPFLSPLSLFQPPTHPLCLNMTVYLSRSYHGASECQWSTWGAPDITHTWNDIHHPRGSSLCLQQDTELLQSHLQHNDSIRTNHQWVGRELLVCQGHAINFTVITITLLLLYKYNPRKNCKLVALYNITNTKQQT